MRVVHYLNQFFGGLGGEEFAGVEPQTRDAAVGPGRLLEQTLGGDNTIVLTIIAGDNYSAEHADDLTEFVLNAVREAKADAFVAGPCFEAGRYGVAAALLCTAVQKELGIPVITAMTEENPGYDLYKRDLYVVDSGRNVAGMKDVFIKMVSLLMKLANGEEISGPTEEGYLPKGILVDAIVEETAGERLVNMLLAKVTGQPYESEFKAATFPPVPAPPPIIDISKARIAIVTDGGVVPKGNPDKIAPSAATNWGSYDISTSNDLSGEDYEVSHRGYDTRYVEEDPDRMVPVDALRALEKSGVIGELHKKFISTSGLSNPLANSRRLGREIAAQLKEDEVDAVILVSA